MSTSNHAINGRKAGQERRATGVRPDGLDTAENVASANLARPGGILAEIASDPDRSAALALARRYQDEANRYRVSDPDRGTFGEWYEYDFRSDHLAKGRHYYRVALGLEKMS